MQKELSTKTINSILEKYEPQRHNIIKALHSLQDAHPLHYISNSILDAVSSFFNITKAETYGIVTYYSMFSIKPRGYHIIRLCQSPVCSMLNIKDLLNHLADRWQLKPGITTEDSMFTLETVECLGACDNAPAMMVNEQLYTELSKARIDEILTHLKEAYHKNL